MPLERMPNGEYVDIADGTPPEVIARIKAKYPATRVQKREQGLNARGRSDKPMTDEQREIDRRASRREKRDISGGFNQFSDMVRGGNFLSFNDEIAGGVSAGTRGVFNAIRKGDIGEIGKEYRIAKGTTNELARRYSERNPVTGAAAEIVGAVANPIGTGAKGVQLAGNALAKAPSLNRAGNTIARVGSRMERAGPVAQGVMAGGLGGGINAAGASENVDTMPSDMLYGAATGALLGGGIGGLGHIAARGGQILKDRGALGRFSGPGGQDGSRAAYARVANLLEKGKMTPEQAARRLKVTDARGGDAMVMDLTPGLTSEAGYLSRQTNLPSSNKMIERGEARFDARRGRAAEQVEGTAVKPQGMKDFDSYRQSDSLSATRKAKGQVDYGPGGPLDKPLQWNDELDDFFAKAPKQTDDAMKSAYDELQLRRDDPNLFAVSSKNNEPVYYPQNFRAWDYMKRGFDAQIGKALQAGERGKAAALSEELNRLKGILGKQNPAYEAVLKGQRDLFQQQAAIDIGNKAWKDIKTRPREALRDLRNLTGEELDNARVGIIDRFMDNILATDDAMRVVTSVTRNSHQAKLLEFAFGGKKEANIFMRWAKRELAARNADTMTKYAGQSQTQRLQAAKEGGEDLNELGVAAASGMGFGGVVGAGANIARKIQHFAQGVSENAQEKIAQILMSKGEDLVPRIKEVVEYMAARKAGNKSRAKWLGKAAQQPFTTEIGGE